MVDRSLRLAFSADINLSGIPLKVHLLRGPNSQTEKNDIFLQIGSNLADQDVSLASLVSQILGPAVKTEIEELFIVDVSLSQVVAEVCLYQKSLTIAAAISPKGDVKTFEDVVRNDYQSLLEGFKGKKESNSFGVYIKKQSGQSLHFCFFVDGPADLYTVATADVDKDGESTYQSLDEKLDDTDAVCKRKRRPPTDPPADPPPVHHTPGGPPVYLPPLVIVAGLGNAISNGVRDFLGGLFSHGGSDGKISFPDNGGDNSGNGDRSKPDENIPPLIIPVLPRVNISALSYDSEELRIWWRQPIDNARGYDIKLTNKDIKTPVYQTFLPQIGQTQTSIPISKNLPVGNYKVSIQPKGYGTEESFITEADFTVDQLPSVDITSINYKRGTLTVTWAQPIADAKGYVIRLTETNTVDTVKGIDPVTIFDKSATQASIAIPSNFLIGVYNVRIQTMAMQSNGQNAQWIKDSEWSTAKGVFNVVQLDPVEVTSVSCENGFLEVTWAQAIDHAKGYSIQLVKSDDPTVVIDLEPVEGGNKTKTSQQIPQDLSVGSYDVQVRANGDDIDSQIEQS